MKKPFAILMFLLTAVTVACKGQATSDEVGDSTKQAHNINDLQYISEDGSLRLEKLNDTLYATYFANNDGFQFDTVMVTTSDNTEFFTALVPEEGFFLKYHSGGLSVSDNQVNVIELSGYGLLGAQTRMFGMYTNAFYRSNQKIKVSGVATGTKGVISVDGVFLDGHELKNGRYYEFEGTATKEKWPIDYYSTDESPQGFLGNDTTKTYYYIQLNNAKDITPAPRIFKGYPVNCNEKNACIAWEFADSEAYILTGHPIWKQDMLEKEITVEGILVQNHMGSFLYNWKIIK